MKDFIQAWMDWFSHLLFGCKKLWVVQHNVQSGKPFKRCCSYCGRKELRTNGEWVFV